MNKQGIRGLLSRLICLCLLTAVLVSGPVSAQAGLNETERARTMTQISQVYHFLTREMGYNTAAACGILGNIDIECSFDPTALSKTGLYYGLCQWGDERRNHLYDFCQENGYRSDTIEGQLRFIQHELESTSYYVNLNRDMLNMPDTAEGAYEAGYYWSYYYERPGDKEASSVKRGNLARSAYWPIFSNAPITPDPPTLSNTAEGIQVRWDPESRADTYILFRRTGEEEEWTRLATLSGTSYLDDEVEVGQTYHYTVEACNAIYSSEYDPEGAACRRLLAPELGQAAAAADRVSIIWEPVEYAEKYRIYRRTSASASWSRIATISADNTSYQDTKAPSGQTCIYTVRAVSGDSVSAYDGTGISAFYLAQPTPSAVNKTDGIRVSWTASPGTTQYRVYRKTAAGWTILVKLPGDTLSWTHKDVAAGESCTYTVRAFCTRDGSTFSSLFSKTGTTLVRVPTVELNSLTCTLTGTTLTWKAVEGADSYRIYRRFSTSDGWSCLADTAGTSLQDTGLKSGSTVYYTVVAFLNKTRGDYDRSGLSLVYLDAPVLTGASNDTSGITLTWKGSQGADRYLVYRREHGTKGWSSPTSVSAASTTWIDTATVSGHTYDYVVRAGKGKFRSSYDPKGITTIRLSAPALKSAANKANGITLTWGATAGATSYRIYRRVESGKWVCAATVSGTQTSWTDTSAANGTLYGYRVRGYASFEGTTVVGAFVSAGISSCYVAPVSSVSALAGTGKLRLTWTPNSKATGYRITYSGSSAFSSASNIQVKGASAGSLDITGLTKGTTCYARVCAFITRNSKTYYSAPGTTVSGRIR